MWLRGLEQAHHMSPTWNLICRSPVGSPSWASTVYWPQVRIYWFVFEHRPKQDPCFLWGEKTQIAVSKSSLRLLCRELMCNLIAVCAVRESEGAYVPGRCLCPQTQAGIRGQMKDLIVYEKSATCSNITVMWVAASANTHVLFIKQRWIRLNVFFSPRAFQSNTKK